MTRVAQVTFRASATLNQERRQLQDARLEEKRPAIVAKRLALAYRIQRDIQEGLSRDMASVAAAHDLTRARLSQIMNLLFLAPDIQEEVLALEFPPGRQPVSERTLRRVLKTLVWSEQRAAWAALRA